MSFKLKVVFTILGSILVATATAAALAFGLKPSDSNAAGSGQPESTYISNILPESSKESAPVINSAATNSSEAIKSAENNQPVQQSPSIPNTASDANSISQSTNTVPQLNSSNGIKITISKGVIDAGNPSKLDIGLTIDNKSGSDFIIKQENFTITPSIGAIALYEMDYAHLTVPFGRIYATQGHISYDAGLVSYPFTISYTFDNGVTATAAIN
jgi:hypothetical protein